jgi:polyisoprenoid-binding protein YceI
MNKKYVIGGGLVAVIAVAVAVWFLFLKDDAPEAVDVGSANDQLDADLAAADDPPAAETDQPDETVAPVDDAPVVDGIDGVWIVDDEVGEFDFESASGSFAGFRVDEELTIGAVTAVGRSGNVTGTVTIADGQLTGAEVTVDMTTISSNDSRRENAIRNAISASEFPEATFTFAGGVDVSALEVGGAAQSFSIEGDMTVAGVTRSVEFDIDANVRDDGFAVIVGSTGLFWEDFGVTPPSAPIVVSVADDGIVEFQLILAR